MAGGLSSNSKQSPGSSSDPLQEEQEMLVLQSPPCKGAGGLSSNSKQNPRSSSDPLQGEQEMLVLQSPPSKMAEGLKPNLKEEIVNEIANKLGLKFIAEKTDEKRSFAPIDLLDYIYAVLHSPVYREKYKEFLKVDFPRIPYPDNPEKFWKLVSKGSELRELHLLESAKVNKYITSYPQDGSNKVEKVEFKGEDIGKVYINSEQYFDNVPKLAWEFYIGGYQPSQKWLKDRKGRELSYEDILHYQKIIVALTETNRLMKEIDEINF